jgi:hypothetical protein
MTTAGLAFWPARNLFQAVGVVLVSLVLVFPAVVVLCLGVQLILELLQAVSFGLLPAAQFKVAEEVRIIVRSSGMPRAAGLRGSVAGAAYQEPEYGTQHRQDDHYHNPCRFRYSAGQAPVSTNHVDEAIHEDGKDCDGQSHTEEHAIKSIVSWRGGCGREAAKLE